MTDSGFRTRADRFDFGVLRVALAWLPYGGADADTVYDEFGLSQQEFAQHLLNVLDRFDPPDLSAATKLRLRDIAQSVISEPAPTTRAVL